MLILSAVFDTQIVIIAGGKMYIRDYTGNPNVWSGWKKYTYANSHLACQHYSPILFLFHTIIHIKLYDKKATISASLKNQYDFHGIKIYIYGMMLSHFLHLLLHTSWSCPASYVRRRTEFLVAVFLCFRHL